MRRYEALFYFLCAVPLACTVIGFTTDVASIWINGVSVVAILCVCYLGQRMLGSKW
jgi:hypothetical protein